MIINYLPSSFGQKNTGLRIKVEDFIPVMSTTHYGKRCE